jgi:hypothetical protein
MAEITTLEETKMLTRLMAAAAFATLAFGTAQAGTLTNGAWAPTGCGANPGAPPAFDGHSQASYTKSTKDFQPWQDKAKTYEQCASEEAKADQNAVVDGVNKAIQAINDASKNYVDQANAAMEKFKASAKK